MTHLRHEDSHSQILRVRRHISEHHDARKTHVALGLADVVHHGSNAARVHDQLRQLKGRKGKDVSFNIKNIL